MSRKGRVLFVLAVAFAIAGTWQVASAAWIHAKAWLAQELIAQAWAASHDTGVAPRPWPGADLRPIARLAVPARGVELYVLDNPSPNALAFGPAWIAGTATPGGDGNSVMVAHRDTHFAFLQRLQADDVIEVEGLRGVHARYRVREATVVQRSETRVLDPADSAQLTLITCYPFDAVRPGTPWRFVVVADRMV